MADIDVQPTKNLAFADAVKKIKELSEDSNSCMFITNLKSSTPGVRPMALQECDEAGTLWYISSSESNKNREIKDNPEVLITFQNNSKWEYLSLNGTASIHTDKSLIEKYWTDFARAWFDGKDDPRITIISVQPDGGHYWDTQHGKVVSGIKAVFSAITGAKNDDGGVDGKLTL